MELHRGTRFYTEKRADSDALVLEKEKEKITSEAVSWPWDQKFLFTDHCQNFHVVKKLEMFGSIVSPCFTQKNFG